ncbi:MAG: twin-arginine translocase subunit TatB [bacterium]|nr:twin-arginine translocase subunit TatB [bacterium]
MFGIGLPEMIVILAVALIVVGPDKLPELARSLAKGVNELKNTMNQVKDSLGEETKVVSSVQQDLQQTAGQMKTQLLENVTTSPNQWKQEGDAAADVTSTEEDEVIEGGSLAPRSWKGGKEPVFQDEGTLERLEVVENVPDDDQSADSENKEDNDTSTPRSASAS